MTDVNHDQVNPTIQQLGGQVPTATKSKSTISPEVENGAVALAEQVLSPSEERLALALELEGTWCAYTATRDRINAAIERQQEIAGELSRAPDEPTRKKLTAERTALTGELVHAAADIEAVAGPYASALGPWAERAFQGAKKQIRRIASEQQPLRNERARVRQRLNPEMPRDKLTGEALEQAESRFADLTEQIRALREESWKFERVAAIAAGSVSKFGESQDASLYNTAGRRRWVAGVRASVSRRTTGLTGMSDVLRPAGP